MCFGGGGYVKLFRYLFYEISNNAKILDHILDMAKSDLTVDSGCMRSPNTGKRFVHGNAWRGSKLSLKAM